MDADRFDSLSRSLSATGSRRGLGRTLAGLVLGGTLGPLLGRIHAIDAEASDKAKKRRKRKKRRKGGSGGGTYDPRPALFNSCLVNDPRRLCGTYGCANRDQSLGCFYCYADIEACCERHLISAAAYCSCVDSLSGFCCPC